MFVDDSRDFLLNFTLQLDESIAFKLYNSPQDALKSLNMAHHPDQQQFNERCLTEYLDAEGSPLTNFTVNLDLAAIHWEVYNPQRFSEISVVVVDYAMPGMNGLEFFKQMENSQVKRILLTGRADERTAVEAFNDGIIDLYIQKQNPNITEVINKSIAKMQFSYFQNMSEIIIKMLSVTSPNCLQDPAFFELFDRIRKENNICEYYLTENSGSFLMLDADGKISYFIVKTEQDLRLHYELAQDNNAPEQILEQLRSGEMIPYFWQIDSMYQGEWNDWSTYLYPAQKAQGQETYYYAVIKEPPNSDIKADRILSYNAYLDQLDFSLS